MITETESRCRGLTDGASVVCGTQALECFVTSLARRLRNLIIVVLSFETGKNGANELCSDLKTVEKKLCNCFFVVYGYTVSYLYV